MKRFFRSVAGKTALFIALVLMFALFAAEIVGIAFVWQTDMRSRPKNEVIGQIAGHHVLIDAYRSVALRNDGDGTDPQIEMRVTDPEGNVVLCTDGFEAAANDENYVRFLFDGFTAKSELTHEKRDAGVPCTAIVYADPMLYADKPEVYLFVRAYDLLEACGSMIYPAAAATLLAAVLLFVALMSVSGRRPGTEELFPGPFEAMPYDVLLAASGAVFFFVLAMLDNNVDELFMILTGVILAGLGSLGLMMSFAGRLKRHALVRKMLLYRLFMLIFRAVRVAVRGFYRLIRAIPAIWRTVLALFVFGFLDIVLLCLTANEPAALLFVRLIELMGLTAVTLYAALAFRRLRRGGDSLASGDYAAKTDTKRLIGGFRTHADALNSISDGMARTVEQRLKSERMKTELITNVSHDLKTPLTSIINYADLISKHPAADAELKGYADVLKRQSDKLKRLINDLTEASRASTGNLDIELSLCDARCFVTQAAGEYQDKLEAAGLTLVTSTPEREMPIRADSRRMWRVFDNIMGNAAKYAQAGTRVFLTLTQEERDAVLTLKNTSREELNIGAEELMERFVRGDRARTTEGNGLGLSIARSLTELQGGRFELAVDGDLFKVTIRFPLADGGDQISRGNR